MTLRRLAQSFLLSLPPLLCSQARSPAQIPVPWLSGYYLNVPLWSDPSVFSDGGFGDAQRLRLMLDPSLGPISFNAAYEHFISWSARQGGGLGLSVPGATAPAGGEWFDLQWVIEDDENIQWTHRFDQLSLTAEVGDALSATVGRQPISWATTLFLTPADPFVPFDPADPFREYRAGVDAARIGVFPGPLSEVELVYRPAKFVFDETVTALGRYKGVVAAWEILGYAGVVHDDLAFSLGTAGGVGRAALRGEVQVRVDDDELTVRGTAGFDTRFSVLKRDLYVVFEYQHDGFGAAGADELEEVILSPPFARGELQVLSADATVWQGSYQIHPLFSTQLLVIWSLNDLSALFAPGLTYSLAANASAQGGLFVGAGNDRVTPDDPLPSEYGALPTTAYVSLTLFF